MKRFIPLALILLFASAGFAQTATPTNPSAAAKKSPLADYAGSWIALFEGHAWLTIRLTGQGTALSGRVQRAHEFQFADSGLIKSVSEDQITETVESAALQGDGLLITTTKDSNTQQADRYLLRLTGTNTADAKMVGMSMPPGMPKPLPWKMSKATAPAVAPARQ